MMNGGRSEKCRTFEFLKWSEFEQYAEESRGKGFEFDGKSWLVMERGGGLDSARSQVVGKRAWRR